MEVYSGAACEFRLAHGAAGAQGSEGSVKILQGTHNRRTL
jgi:hypothetical protein